MAGLSTINQGQATGARWAPAPAQSLPCVTVREGGRWLATPASWPWLARAGPPRSGPGRQRTSLGWWAGWLGSDSVWGVGRSSEICEGHFISQRPNLPCL